MFFRFNHPHFLAAAFLSRPTPFGLIGVNGRASHRTLSLLQFRAQLRPGQLAIRRLGAFPLTTHDDASWPMAQPDRRTGLVDLLAPGTRTAHEPLLDVTCAHPQSCQPTIDLGW
jgi:hypothetical protein